MPAGTDGFREHEKQSLSGAPAGQIGLCSYL